MGTMAIPDHTGHTSVAWRHRRPRIGRGRRAHLRHPRGQRLVPFARRAPGDEFEQVRGFDATLAEILWVRPLQGG